MILLRKEGIVLVCQQGQANLGTANKEVRTLLAEILI